MWSLPDIVRLNNEAAADAAQSKLQRQVEKPQEHCCEVCEWDGKENPADYGYLWFDIFSDDPKGTIFLCEQHDGYTGSPMEGYLQCADCDRVFIENYTWERYSTIVDDEELCLPCALKRYIDDAFNWIPTDAVSEVILDSNADGNEIFDPTSGTLNLAKVPHLIGVEMPVPDDLHFIDNLEFDSMTGAMLASTSTTFDSGVGESAALRAIQELEEQGYEKCLLILDAAYQFSVSIGIYVNSAEHRRIQSGEAADIQDAVDAMMESEAL